LYPDFYASRAFAVADHEIAHIYLKEPELRGRAKEIFNSMDGIEDVLDVKRQSKRGVAHERSGELILVAERGYWFAYPWWSESSQAPDYATHVDIHNKPGYDPCELFSGWNPFSISTDTGKIRGSHGRRSGGRSVGWASTCSLSPEPRSLIDLAVAVCNWLEEA
ncbi:alkaline phosphatase family protein, partial [Fibrobacterota bacterium]